MKTKELREKSREELKQILKEKQKEVKDFTFGSAKGQIKNVKAKREARKIIARVLTILNQKK